MKVISVEFNFKKDNPTYLRHGDLILDLNDNTAFLQGSELTLTAKEFAILELLMKYPDKIFSKSKFISKCLEHRVYQ